MVKILALRGFYYKARMTNDALFRIWSPIPISMQEARKRLLEEATEYKSADILRIWRTRS